MKLDNYHSLHIHFKRTNTNTVKCLVKLRLLTPHFRNYYQKSNSTHKKATKIFQDRVKWVFGKNKDGFCNTSLEYMPNMDAFKRDSCKIASGRNQVSRQIWKDFLFTHKTN